MCIKGNVSRRFSLFLIFPYNVYTTAKAMKVTDKLLEQMGEFVILIKTDKGLIKEGV